MPHPESLKDITDFPSLVAYLRDELDWEIPEDLPYEKLTYSYTADELGLKLDTAVEITQLRPILGQQNAWGVFFVDFDKADLPVTLLRRILSSVSRRKRESANPGDRALFDKNDLLFVSAFGKADDRRLALAHFHQEPETSALPTLRVLTWDRQDTKRHMDTVAERLDRLRWPARSEAEGTWKARWTGAFVTRPHGAITASKDMARALADSARQIRVAIQEILPKEKPGQPLTHLYDAVTATLNKDLDAAKFADTYAQTIAYGLLSKRIDQVQRWRAEKARTMNGQLPLPPITADALETAIPTNPFLSDLLTSFMGAVGRGAGGSALDFDELGLGDLVELLNTADMEAVLDDFDKDKQGDDPVIHFYEGFLAAYDKAMKVQRGVFYSPKPVVSFIVRSVDEVLRTDFDLPLGLADTTTWGEFVAAHPDISIPQGVRPGDAFVKILDPATGTGTFLVEVIDLIHHRMTEEVWKGRPAAEKARLWNEYVPRHLLPRLYGYELMMAPYAVAHMKIGLKLGDTGYDFSGVEAGPDGCERPVRARVFLTNALEPAQDLDMQLAFMNEALAHEARAANDAKARTRFTVVVGNPPYSKLSANRSRYIDAIMAKYKTSILTEEIQRQALSNDYVKFFAAVFHFLGQSGVYAVSMITDNSFLDGPLFRDMRGELVTSTNAIDIIDLGGNSRRASEVVADENVFDIQQGVCVTTAARTPKVRRPLRYLRLRGTRASKAIALEKQSLLTGEELTPVEPNWWFSPRPEIEDDIYGASPALPEIFAGAKRAGRSLPFNGAALATRHDSFAIAFSREELEANIDALLDRKSSDAELTRRFGLCTTTHFDIGRARRVPRSEAVAAIRPILYRPFDLRWVVYHPLMIGEPRPEVMNLLLRNNLALLSTRRVTGKPYDNVFIANGLVEYKAATHDRNTQVFPLYLYNSAEGSSEMTGCSINPNFSARYGAEIRASGCENELEAFHFLYAVLHSPTYRSRYQGRLEEDYARIPFPKDRELCAALVPLGTKLAALHLLDVDALPNLLADPKVRFVCNGGEPRLGRFKNDVRRDPSGRVYLNDQNWFATVSAAAWDHPIGGYEPAQKWLKDRSQTGSGAKLKPGRLLSADDILHYRRMIVALEETGKVMAKIDAVIEEHGGWPGAFKGMTE